MEKKIMNKHSSRIGFVLGFLTLLAGVQAATAANCAGTAYIKVPDEWTDLYIYYGNESTKVPATAFNAAEGYYVYNLANVKGNDNSTFIVYTTIDGTNIDSPGVRRMDGTGADYTASGRPGLRDFQCPGAGEKIYIQPDDTRPGKTYVNNVPPTAKYFYVLVPEVKEWQSDEMMIHYELNGVAKDTAMSPLQTMCGWYGMVFNDAPTDVYMFLKNSPDMQLGMNGLWGEEEVATPVNLSLLYDAYATSTLYFIPDDNDWPGEEDGGWYTSDPGVPEPGNNSRCTFSLAAVIYDTDKSVNPLFTEDAIDVTGYGTCVGVHHGMVMTDLGPDNKPVFNGNNAWAKTCFTNADNFNTLFNYVPGKNEVKCYDMPFRHYGNDTRWGYDSDSAVTNGLIGGFSPLENSTDADVVTLNINGVPTLAGPLAAARTKRPACGPVPNFADSVLGVPLDYYCKTPGWPTGKDCEGLFANGDDAVGAIWCWGDYCKPGFNRWGQDGTVSKTETRNQHFCFESHATFTYNDAQEFTFRGDDDIWVFINRKIAVDNGGAHLAAPGHVKLSNLNTTYGAGFLVPGNDYPIDIFFCDRRTTMSNVIIKTNMYIKQSTGVELGGEKSAGGDIKLNICVHTEGGGDCAAVALGGGTGQEKTTKCGDEIDQPITFSITTRKGETPAGCADCAALPYGPTAGVNGVVHGGFNLSDPRVPIINQDKITGLAPGTYYLNVEVNGSKEKFRIKVKGNLGIVSNDVEFLNVDEDESVYASGTKWKFINAGMAGTRVPIYVSAPDDYGGVDLISAPGQAYTLTLTAGATLYKTNDPNDPNYALPLATPYAGSVNPTGIDTFWLEVPLAGLSAGSMPVTASVGNTSATITFHAPTITFAEPATKDSLGNVLTWNPVIQDPDFEADGVTEYFHWVGSDVDFYLIVSNPVTGALCTECTFPIDISDASPGIVVAEGFPVMVAEGVWLVRIRSNVEYEVNAASMVAAAIENNAIAAPYGNMHFFKPPAPMPLIVDMFDVKGEVLGEMNVPSDFYDPTAKYLDGKADSMAIIYDRKIDKDSVPTFVCLDFDEATAKEINPYEMGISNNKNDTKLNCSTQFDSAQVALAFSKSPDGGRTLVFAVDEPLSRDVKTVVNPENKVYSFTEYEWKKKKVKTYFSKGLTDRMAPIILSARASTETDGGVYDQVRIIVSEPVSVMDASYGAQAFSYYLNSAIDIASEAARYIHVTAQGVPQPKRDTLNIRYYNADPQNPTPHVGDYVRFRADQLIWADTSNGYAAGSDTLRQASDADWHWNSPTNYNATNRLPSPWVQVTGDAKIDVNTITYNVADPSKVTPETPIGEVFPVKTTDNMEKVKADHPGTLGHFVQSDMGSIIGSKDEYAALDKSTVYFYYEVDYFTNLGAFVARQSGKIYCNDPFFSPDPSTTPAGMGDCVKNPRNFFVAWNMLADNHRLVGTGAYITKYTSYVQLGEKGKKAKKEITEVWGVKRGKGVVK
ncbi:MAG: fibro-slime domain-containing protein [Fibrobacter sp.]|nr:fibro-slime domain-containing protein [Fibrobacter sp.]